MIPADGHGPKSDLEMVDPEPERHDDVCRRCKETPWDELASPPLLMKQVLDITEPHVQLRSSSCRICRLLAKIKPPSLDGKACSLLAFSAAQALSRKRPPTFAHSDSTLLFVSADPIGLKTFKSALQNGFIGLSKQGQQFDVGILPMDPNAIAFAKLQRCVTYCRERHCHLCARPAFRPVAEFRVIDCRDPKQSIVTAPATCRYAALSYVWGDASEASSLNGYPRVVADAIEATMSMELQYLWVDRYCIDQNDESDKRRQVSQMGSIYAKAEITIIAAAGTDSTYGLPGISRPRQQQGRETINSVTLLEGFPHVFYSAKESVWASRGWTYQEGFLSPRRLIFADRGVSYLCSGMCLSEYEKIPLGMTTRDSTALFGSLIPRSLDRGYRLSNDAQSMLAEYSRRRLRYSSDALNAIMGILQLLEGHGIYSIWGLTISGQPMLHWHHENLSKRRPEFPSWSYLGWEGHIDIDNDVDYRTRASFQVSLGERAREPHFPGGALPAIAKQLKGLGKDAPRYLHMRGPVINVPLENRHWTDEERLHRTTIDLTMKHGHHRIIKLDDTPSDGVYASLRISTGVRMLVKAQLDKPDFRARCVVGITLLHSSSSTSSFEFTNNSNWILLVERRGACYERIGLLRWRLHADSTLKVARRDIVFTTESGELLDKVVLSRKEEPLWFTEAKTKTVVIG
ncbi:HET-domain-containing protein [Hypoxylon sp. FL0890]|nr:HET-domain-containing protein [Hypoxylon sp. FL0890]